MATTPPGWYDDARGALRWWDGAQWTEHVQTPDPEPSEEAAPTPPDPIAPAPTLESAKTDASLPAQADASDSVPEGGYSPSEPPGYPGGFTGGPAPSGGFIAATEPKKSRLWILWVVLGVVLLGIVILATVLIPIMIGMFGSATSSGGDSDDEAAAVAAVELYDEAWATADCQKFETATTESFREVSEIPDCTSFTAASQGFSESVEDYEVTVSSVETVSEEEITVVTTETYTAMTDEQGNPTDEAVPHEDIWVYVVVPSGDGWAIDATRDAVEE